MHLWTHSGLLLTQLQSSGKEFFGCKPSQIHVYQMLYSQLCAVCLKIVNWLIRWSCSYCVYTQAQVLKLPAKLWNTFYRGSRSFISSLFYGLQLYSLTDSQVFFERLEQTYSEKLLDWKSVFSLACWLFFFQKQTNLLSCYKLLTFLSLFYSWWLSSKFLKPSDSYSPTKGNYFSDFKCNNHSLSFLLYIFLLVMFLFTF